MAKHKSAKRRGAKVRTDDAKRTIATTTLTKEQLHLRRQRWRALKKRFDHVHQVGMGSLKRRDYESLNAAILHERRIIDDMRALIEEARTQIGIYKTRR